MHTNLILPAADYRRSRTAWLAARKSGLGASETAAILGVDPWKSPLDVYLDKISPDTTDTVVSEAAEWGSVIEAVVARKVATRHPELGKLTPSPGLAAHPDHRWLLATPDRLLIHRDTGIEAPLEIKTTDGRNKPDWADGPPHRVQVQVQQQLAVLGLEVAYVAVLFGGREMPAPFVIHRDQTVIDLIIEHAGAFWRDHVEPRIAPEARIGDAQALTNLYPGDNDLEPLLADTNLEDLFTRRHALQNGGKRLDAELEEIDNAIKEAMGDHTTVIDTDGTVLATWKPGSRTGLDTKRLKADHPDLTAQYATTTTYRTFKPKEIK